MFITRLENRSRRRGVSAVLVMVSLTALVGFAALTVDVGVMYHTRAELQRTADAAAMAGTMRLLDQDRVKGGSELAAIILASRDRAAEYAAKNNVYNDSPDLAYGDVNVGYLTDPNDGAETLDFSDPTRFNAVSVTVRRDGSVNGPIDLLFARVFGKQSTDLTASSTAAVMDGIVGFRVTDATGNAGLLPFTLRRSAWLDYLAGLIGSGDNYSYDPDTGLVSNGSDGIPELNLYPGSGAGQLPPGNFGTIDIGAPGNSAADLSRQIRYGVNAEDLAYFGGEIKLGDDGTLILNGDTGLSGGIADDLVAVIGEARTIPIFSKVTGPGDNANFTIVGFVGVRIVNVKLTGSQNSKRVLIQPAVVVDDAAIAGDATGNSYFVYEPVTIVR